MSGWRGGPSATMERPPSYTSLADDSPTVGKPPSYASSGDVPSAWWEDGAKNILQGYDIQAIRLVCRFRRTYRDESVPRDILRTRCESFLDDCFASLHAGDRETFAELDVAQKVEVILEQLSPDLLSPETLQKAQIRMLKGR